jgi:hypothetical protein
MTKIRLLYIITEIILIIALLWAALNLSFFVDDFEAISNLSRLVSSFGIAMVLVGGITFRKKYPNAVIFAMLLFTVAFYHLEKIAFERYTEIASKEVILSSFSKVMAMSLMPDETALIDRIKFRVGVELMDEKVLTARLNRYIGKNNMLDVVEHRVTMEAGGYDFSGIKESDPMHGQNEEWLLSSIEGAYINSLYRSKNIYKLADRYKSDGVSYEDYVLNYMRDVTFSGKEETTGGLIWLWYLQSEGEVSPKKLRILRSDADYRDFRRTKVLPEIHRLLKSTSVTLNPDAFYKLGGSRYIGESAHLLWMVTTVGVLIAFLSLLMNIVALIKESRQPEH